MRETGTRPRFFRRGFSLVGLLVSLVCIVVLMTIGLSALNKSVTGEGSAVDGTVRSFEDKFKLYAVYQSMVAHAGDHRDRYLVPSVITGSDDASEDVTANLFSAMLMDNYTNADGLIAANEFSGYVYPMEDYNFRIFNPREGVYWDPKFMADLADLSNVSFAHVPLYGERLRRQWQSGMGSDTVILGNRGPKDGIDDPQSFTYGRNARWGGHVVFGDGHVEFLDTFTPGNIYFERDGARAADNIFAVETGPDGRDAILSFTKTMTEAGPELQHD